MPETTHYILLTVGTTGDVHPFMSMARAVRALGQHVTVISNSIHAPLVQDANLPFVGIGSEAEYQRVLANPDLWNPKKGFEALMKDYGDQLQQVRGAIQSVAHGRRTVVIAHPFAVPGAVIAREQGWVQSVVATYLAPGNLKSCHDPLTIGATAIPHWVPMAWRRALWHFVEKGWIDPFTVAQINTVRAALGLAQVPSFLNHIAQAPDLSITLFPAWYAPTPPDWPKPLISGDFPLFEGSHEAALSTALGDFLDGGERPVVFTPGTGNLHAAHFFTCALAAVQQLGRRAIFLTRDRGQVPAELPASVLWQSYAPLATLLPRCAALVHHGGIGTTAEALRAGTSQLVVPFAWDQFDNANRVKALGVGTVIHAQHLSTRKLARHLRTLGNAPSIQTQCAVAAARFNQSHDPKTLCKAIESALHNC
ncbi:glycosyltransferase [Rhodoferax sp.]|uniref:glycosyltransferase n=1 Tax=Rhodoferax sp. TaxID=50421 RepID=UPI0025E46C56|nr:glycosyltransferase [Rhodoferax sp.]